MLSILGTAAQCLFLGGYSGFPVHCKLKGETFKTEKGLIMVRFSKR